MSYPYSHTTFDTLKTQLLNRLGDPNGVYWTSAEVAIYLTEALRTWGLLTNFWRDSAAFTYPGSDGTIHDLTGLTNTIGIPLLSHTVTDVDLATEIEYHLLEPPSGSTWTGSEQFTMDDVLNSMQRRRDLLLAETGAVLSHTTVNLPAGTSRITLADTIMNVRRVAWVDAAGTAHALFPEDINTQRNYSSTFLTTQGTPLTYSSITGQPNQFIIAPLPNVPGTLDIIYVSSGVSLTGAGVSLGVPDDMSWVIKWGALADLLGKGGPGQDLPRSYFCERRWRLGVEVCKSVPLVLNAVVAGASTSPEPFGQMDTYNSNWQTTTGTPAFLINIRNLVATYPQPSAAGQLVVDVVRKAIIPGENGNNFVQVGRDQLDPILDYAEHLALFKSGGYEFRHTYRGADNFFHAALAYNQRLAAQTPSIRDLIKQSTEDDSFYRRERPVSDAPLQNVTQISDQGETLKQLYQQ